MESFCASVVGDRDAVTPTMPRASKAQLKMVMCGPMSRLCVGQQRQCAHARASEGQVIPVPKPGREG